MIVEVPGKESAGNCGSREHRVPDGPAERAVHVGHFLLGNRPVAGPRAGGLVEVAVAIGPRQAIIGRQPVSNWSEIVWPEDTVTTVPLSL